MIPIVVFSVLIFLLALDYAAFLIRIVRLWKNHNEVVEIPETTLPFISIIIALRNEESQIKACLESIASNDLPEAEFEIIVIDDHSEDNSIEQAQSLKLSNLIIVSMKEFEQYGKKSALRKGVERAKGDLLLFTDADTTVPRSWIRSMASHLFSRDLKLVTGPIRVISENSILQLFQALDVAGTMLWTGSGIWSQKSYLANGANLAVKKEEYRRYSDQIKDEIVSGDDVFLIQAIARDHPNQVDFIKSRKTIVNVSPEKSWSALINQRLRWASKTGQYSNRTLTFRIGKIYLLNLLILFGVIIAAICSKQLLAVAFGTLLIKVGIEIYLLNIVSKYFNISIPSHTKPILTIIQTIYVALIGTLTLLGKESKWKGRRV